MRVSVGWTDIQPRQTRLAVLLLCLDALKPRTFDTPNHCTHAGKRVWATSHFTET